MPHAQLATQKSKKKQKTTLKAEKFFNDVDKVFNNLQNDDSKVKSLANEKFEKTLAKYDDFLISNTNSLSDPETNLIIQQHNLIIEVFKSAPSLIEALQAIEQIQGWQDILNTQAAEAIEAKTSQPATALTKSPETANKPQTLTFTADILKRPIYAQVFAPFAVGETIKVQPILTLKDLVLLKASEESKPREQQKMHTWATRSEGDERNRLEFIRTEWSGIDGLTKGVLAEFPGNQEFNSLPGSWNRTLENEGIFLPKVRLPLLRIRNHLIENQKQVIRQRRDLPTKINNDWGRFKNYHSDKISLKTNI